MLIPRTRHQVVNGLWQPEKALGKKEKARVATGIQRDEPGCSEQGNVEVPEAQLQP